MAEQTPVKDQTPVHELSGHVVILNVNEKVRRIVEEIALGSAGNPADIVVVVQDELLWESNPAWHPRPDSRINLRTVIGSPTEPADLEKIGIAGARAAVILADPRQEQLADAHSTLIAVAIERRCPQVHTVTELIDSVNRVHLRATEVNEVICFGELTEKLIAQSCITPGITNVFSDLLHAHPGTTQVFLCDLPPNLEGRTYRQVARRVIKARAGFLLCGYSRPNLDLTTAGPCRNGHTVRETFVLNPWAGIEPGKDTPLQCGDRLVVIAYERPDVEQILGSS